MMPDVMDVRNGRGRVGSSTGESEGGDWDTPRGLAGGADVFGRFLRYGGRSPITCDKFVNPPRTLPPTT